MNAEIADFIHPTQVELNPGDAVVLYIDGMSERENLYGVQYRLERLCDLLPENRQRSAEGIHQVAIADLRQHLSQQNLFDDLPLWC